MIGCEAGSKPDLPANYGDIMNEYEKKIVLSLLDRKANSKFEISRRTGICPCTAYKWIEELEKSGLIKLEKEYGRYSVELTENGILSANQLKG